MNSNSNTVAGGAFSGLPLDAMLLAFTFLDPQSQLLFFRTSSLMFESAQNNGYLEAAVDSVVNNFLRAIALATPARYGVESLPTSLSSSPFKPNVLYLSFLDEKIPTAIVYTVISPTGEIVRDKIALKNLKTRRRTRIYIETILQIFQFHYEGKYRQFGYPISFFNTLVSDRDKDCEITDETEAFSKNWVKFEGKENIPKSYLDFMHRQVFDLAPFSILKFDEIIRFAAKHLPLGSESLEEAKESKDSISEEGEKFVARLQRDYQEHKTIDQLFIFQYLLEDILEITAARGHTYATSAEMVLSRDLRKSHMDLTKALNAAGDITDYVGNHFEGIKALQYPVWAKDKHMYQMLSKKMFIGETLEQLVEMKEERFVSQHGTFWDCPKEYDVFYRAEVNAVSIEGLSIDELEQFRKDKLQRLWEGKVNIPTLIKIPQTKKQKPLYYFYGYEGDGVTPQLVRLESAGFEKAIEILDVLNTEEKAQIAANQIRISICGEYKELHQEIERVKGYFYNPLTLASQEYSDALIEDRQLRPNDNDRFSQPSAQVQNLDNKIGQAQRTVPVHFADEICRTQHSLHTDPEVKVQEDKLPRDRRLENSQHWFPLEDNNCDFRLYLPEVYQVPPSLETLEEKGCPLPALIKYIPAHESGAEPTPKFYLYAWDPVSRKPKLSESFEFKDYWFENLKFAGDSNVIALGSPLFSQLLETKLVFSSLGLTYSISKTGGQMKLPSKAAYALVFANGIFEGRAGDLLTYKSLSARSTKDVHDFMDSISLDAKAYIQRISDGEINDEVKQDVGEINYGISSLVSCVEAEINFAQDFIFKPYHDILAFIQTPNEFKGSHEELSLYLEICFGLDSGQEANNLVTVTATQIRAQLEESTGERWTSAGKAALISYVNDSLSKVEDLLKNLKLIASTLMKYENPQDFASQMSTIALPGLDYAISMLSQDLEGFRLNPEPDFKALADYIKKAAALKIAVLIKLKYEKGLATVKQGELSESNFPIANGTAKSMSLAGLITTLNTNSIEIPSSASSSSPDPDQAIIGSSSVNLGA